MMYPYRDNGLRLLLPPRFKVASPSPNFYAKRKRDTIAHMAIEMFLADSQWAHWQFLLREPVGLNPELESRILHEGAVATPYPGYERVVEHRVIATSISHFYWARLVEADGLRMLINILDFAEFDERRKEWTDVMDSIDVSAAKKQLRCEFRN